MYTLVIGRSYPEKDTGMMGIFEFEHAIALKKYGNETIYCFVDTRSVKRLRKKKEFYLNKEGLEIYGYYYPIGGLPNSLFNNLKTKKTLKLLNKIIAQHGLPQNIHIHYPLINLTDGIWEKIKTYNVPIIVTEHWSKVQNQTIEPYRKTFLKKIVKESDTIITVGKKLKASVIEITKTNKEVLVIPNILNEAFEYIEAENKNKFKFIFIGSLIPSKKVDLLITAFRNVFNTTEIELHIVGNGKLFKKLSKKIKKDNLKNVFMHGYLTREKTAFLLQNCDVFVSASEIETFGVPFIEALACGKPVIGISDSSIASYINEANGLLFENGNIKQLESALKKIYEQKDKYNSCLIAQNAKEIFGEENIIKQLKSIYSKLNGEKY
ncbi:glycosyltransferase [Ornithinibacillus sp. 4-3]|uniref:Glycosyltransferase n=1 Tax=Ornithinibacillus sp. 4-3 TaxID=3231488 RepID=A0AB39HNP5_9BACI